MAWDEPDLYNQPEQFGLTTIGSVSWAEANYSFDLTIVWQHTDGTFYLASDTGCSCPSPFQDFTSLDKAEHFLLGHEVMVRLDELTRSAEEHNYDWYAWGRHHVPASVLDLKAQVMKASNPSPDEIREAIRSIERVLEDKS